MLITLINGPCNGRQVNVNEGTIEYRSPVPKPFDWLQPFTGPFPAEPNYMEMDLEIAVYAFSGLANVSSSGVVGSVIFFYRRTEHA